MGLRIFPVMGAALNFGGRRLETIARVAWLPVVLLLLTYMAAIFGYLSIIEERLITFEDIPTYLDAQRKYVQFAARGFENNATGMWVISAAVFVIQTILVAKFMAPLIRYAGLGEKPEPGVLRAPFGADQIRFVLTGFFSFLLVAVLVLGPLAGAAYFAIKYIVDAMSQTMAVFPDPDSLHTIQVTTAGAALSEAGVAWVYSRAFPAFVVAPFFLLLWLLLFLHFSPRNRPSAPSRSNFFLRAMGTLLASLLFLVPAYLFFRQAILSFYKNVIAVNVLAAKELQNSELTTAQQIGAELIEVTKYLSLSPVDTVLVFGLVAYLLVIYLNLRLFAYPGVAVCRKSMGFGHLFEVTRGWNILRLLIIVTLIGVGLWYIQVQILNGLFLNRLLPTVVNMLYQATAVSTRLVNSGETAPWVLPAFIWMWNITKILLNLLWSFFSFGVSAGLYGRLYRESEHAIKDHDLREAVQ